MFLSSKGTIVLSTWNDDVSFSPKKDEGGSGLIYVEWDRYKLPFDTRSTSSSYPIWASPDFSPNLSTDVVESASQE